MTKKRVLGGSLIGIVIGLLLLNIENFWFCFSAYRGYGATECARATQSDVVASIELIFMPLFFITLLLFFVRDEVFNFWFKFARVALPLSVLMIMSTSPRGSFFVSDRAITFGLVSILFLSVSFILVVYKILQLRKRNH